MQQLEPAAGLELAPVAPPELVPATRVMTEPPAQLCARRQLTQPLGERRPLLRDAARPEAIDEDALAVGGRRRFPDALRHQAGTGRARRAIARALHPPSVCSRTPGGERGAPPRCCPKEPRNADNGPMGLWQRFRLVVRGRASRALDSMENPADALDLAYEKQIEALQRVRRGVADVVTAQKQLEIQARQMEGNRARLDELARTALAQNREEVAASALTQSELLEGQLAGLRQQAAALTQQRENLEVAGERLQARVAAMRTQKETLKAQYSAAQATVQAGETASGISKEMDDVQLLLERARDRMLRTQARAEAVTELMDTGVLSRLGAGGVEGIEAQVRATAVEQSVDQRLAAMKAELGLTGSPVAGRIEGGHDAVPAADTDTQERDG